MKRLLTLILLLATTALFASSCHNHSSHKGDHGKNHKKDHGKHITVKHQKKTGVKMVHTALHDQLLPYFAIHKTFVKDSNDIKKDVAKLVQNLENAVKKAPKEQKDSLNNLVALAKKIDQPKLEDSRRNYFEFTKNVVKHIKKFNQKDSRFYPYYCPMAKKSWIQNSDDDLLNPYMPKQMLHCGRALKL